MHSHAGASVTTIEVMRILALTILVAGCAFEHGALSQEPDAGSTSSPSIDASASATVDAPSTLSCDRTCPIGSTCSGGHCQPPAGATACAQESDCSGGQVCNLFVISGSLVGYCTDSSGSNDGRIIPCVNDDDSTCPSHLECNHVDNPKLIEGVSTSNQYGCFDD